MESVLRITGKFPGYLSPSMDIKFADVPNGLAAISKVPVAGWAQILAYMSFCEISQKQDPGTKPYDGDFGWKVLTSDDPEIKKKKLNSELANGRLAMVGIIGLFFQDGITGSPWGYWAGNPSSFWKAESFLFAWEWNFCFRITGLEVLVLSAAPSVMITLQGNVRVLVQPLYGRISPELNGQAEA